jgi:hypothetical protein
MDNNPSVYNMSKNDRKEVVYECIQGPLERKSANSMSIVDSRRPVGQEMTMLSAGILGAVFVQAPESERYHELSSFIAL